MTAATGFWRWWNSTPLRAALAIGLGGLALTASLVGWQAQQNARFTEMEFVRQSDALAEELRKRVADYQHGLRSLRGVFNVKPDLSRAEFNAYATSRDLAGEFPGALGIGFVRRVPPEDQVKFVRRRQNELGAGFRIFSKDDKPGEGWIVDYYWPDNIVRSVGYDMGSDPTRGNAFRAAMLSGSAALSAPNELKRIGLSGIGLSYVLPIYRSGLPTDTLEQREAAIFGWALLTLHVDEVFSGLNRQLAFNLLDVTDASSPLPIYATGEAAVSGPTHWRRNYDIELGHRLWRLVIAPEASFDAGVTLRSPAWFAVGGVPFALLLALATYLPLATRSRAEALAIRMTRELRLSQEREHDFSLCASDWFWETDTQDRFLFISENAGKIIGRSPSSSIGHPRLALIEENPHNSPELVAAYQAVLDARQPFRDFVYRICGNGGTQHWISISGVPYYDQQGCFAGYRGIGSIIDKRKESEAELIRARDEAEQANRAKSDFLSTMSHELRTPMNAIIGFAQMLEYDHELSADQQDNAHEILKAGHHLLDLINEVLDLAKIESGRIDLSLEPVEIWPVLQECLHLVSALAERRNIRISHHDLAGWAVRADRTRFKQVVLNLLSNAIKYNRAGGSVTVDAVAAGTDRLRIRVADTGLGIPPERREELFQPFNRLGTENSEIEGTGIGLTITRRVVALMGGSVDLDSEVGRGSTFWIELPVAAASVPVLAAETEKVGADETAPPAVAPPRRRVLHIEDNPANLKLVAHILGKFRAVELLSAHTPQLGIELALAHLPDLILLDINLPGMNGYQVLQTLKAEASLRDTPVIAVTANAMPRDVERGKAAGFVAYLTKPLDVGAFLHTIDTLIGTGEESLS